MTQGYQRSPQPWRLFFYWLQQFSLRFDRRSDDLQQPRSTLVNMGDDGRPHTWIPETFEMGSDIPDGLILVWLGFEELADLVGHLDEMMYVHG